MAKISPEHLVTMCLLGSKHIVTKCCGSKMANFITRLFRLMLQQWNFGATDLIEMKIEQSCHDSFMARMISHMDNLTNHKDRLSILLVVWMTQNLEPIKVFHFWMMSFGDWTITELVHHVTPLHLTLLLSLTFMSIGNTHHWTWLWLLYWYPIFMSIGNTHHWKWLWLLYWYPIFMSIGNTHHWKWLWLLYWYPIFLSIGNTYHWTWLWLLYWYPIFMSSHCNSFEDQAALCVPRFCLQVSDFPVSSRDVTTWQGIRIQ